MVRVSCFTNLDNYEREEWPKEMVCAPRSGDRVEARSGKVLKVVGVTHTMTHGGMREPYLRVELWRAAYLNEPPVPSDDEIVSVLERKRTLVETARILSNDEAARVLMKRQTLVEAVGTLEEKVAHARRMAHKDTRPTVGCIECGEQACGWCMCDRGNKAMDAVRREESS